jgi:hypothetical protein
LVKPVEVCCCQYGQYLWAVQSVILHGLPYAPSLFFVQVVSQFGRIQGVRSRVRNPRLRPAPLQCRKLLPKHQVFQEQVPAKAGQTNRRGRQKPQPPHHVASSTLGGATSGAFAICLNSRQIFILRAAAGFAFPTRVANSNCRSRLTTCSGMCFRPSAIQGCFQTGFSHLRSYRICRADHWGRA